MSIGPNLCHPMASAVIPPRKLASTMGPAAALAGVFIRTGSLIASGERLVCGHVHRFGSLNVVSDNAGCFGSRPLPRNGCLIDFGALTVYVATEVPCWFPERVQLGADPPAVCAARGRRTARPASCVEVMMTAPGAGVGKAMAGDADAGSKSARPGRPPLERPENRAAQASASSVPVTPSPLQNVIEKLATPVAPSADAALAQAELEEQHKNILLEAIEVV